MLLLLKFLYNVSFSKNTIGLKAQYKSSFLPNKLLFSHSVDWGFDLAAVCLFANYFMPLGKQ